MHVSTLLADHDIGCFSEILGPYRQIDDRLKICIDGGAGLGETAEKIFRGLPQDDVRVVGYEPNRANITEFRFHDPRLTVIEAALGAQEGRANFQIATTTQRESDKSPYLVLGTSFVGKLAEGPAPTGGETYEVGVVRLDESLAARGLGAPQFIKLDLQGGELDALQGLGGMIGDVHWMWLEYGGQPGLLDFLEDHGFVLFDTEYLFFGEMKPGVEEMFRITRQGQNSIGMQIFFGRRRQIWTDYRESFAFCRKERGMIQTDIVAVAPRHLAVFLDACQSKVMGRGPSGG